MKIYLETIVHQNYEKVIAGFDLKLFEALKPPFVAMKVERYDGSKKGDVVALEINLFGRKQKWVSLITDHGANENQTWFIDVGEKLPPPLKSWHHKHSIVRLSEFKSKIIDDIDFKTSNKALDLAIYPALYAQFAYRIPVYKRYFNTLK